MLERRLKDKVIVLAGCGWIGSASARRYASEGARLVVADIDGDQARALAAELTEGGAQAVGTDVDGASEETIAALVALALDRFGRIDGFHANFASFADARSQEGIGMPMEMFDEVMQINARGFFLCARHAIPAMLKTGGGAILFTSSIDAYSGAPVRPAYQMSKAALHALMRHIASRYSPEGVRANVVTPGFTINPRLEKTLGEKGMQDAIDRARIKSRLGKPEDIAAMSAFLLSDDAGYVTGQVMTVDGGITMRP